MTPAIAIAAMLQSLTVTGSFDVMRSTDPVTDVETTWAVMGEGDRYLAIGCNLGENSEDEDVYVRVETPEFLGSASGGDLIGGRQLTYRFDDGEPVTELWDYFDHGALQYRTRLVRPFVESLLTAENLVLRAYDYRARPFDISFDIDDKSGVIRAVLDECGDDNMP